MEDDPACRDEEEVQTKPISERITPLVQRNAGLDEEEDAEKLLQTETYAGAFLQRQDEEPEEEELISAKRQSGRSPQVGSDLEGKFQSLRGSGEPLTPTVRDYFEPRFGCDFGQVRVHTGARATSVARAIDARAFTVGRDVVFGEGEYSPGTESGKKLLSHELTHTIQQGVSPSDHRRKPTVMGHAQRLKPSAMGNRAWQLTKSVSIFPMVMRQGGGSGGQKPQTTCNAKSVQQLKQAALKLLDDAIVQMAKYWVGWFWVQVGGKKATPELERIGSALDWNFNTRDWQYAQVVHNRLKLMASVLKSGTTLKIRCAMSTDPSCALRTFSQWTLAYVSKPYEIVLCPFTSIKKGMVDTFIHELVHAVVPAVGTKAKVSSSMSSPLDRAYTHHRIYRHLSTEEALHNADSYSTLVRHLVDRRITAPPLPHADKIKGCTPSDRSNVRLAVARAEQWNYSASKWNQVAYEAMDKHGALANVEINRVKPYFSPVNLARLKLLAAFFQRMREQFRQLDVYVHCTKSRKRCKGSVLGYSVQEAVTSSKIDKMAGRLSDFVIYLCPQWTKVGSENQIRSIYALFILSQPAWMTKSINRVDVYKYVDLARNLNAYLLPAPIAKGAFEHTLADIKAGRTPSPTVK